jgi:hypothetical protein
MLTPSRRCDDADLEREGVFAKVITTLGLATTIAPLSMAAIIASPALAQSASSEGATGSAKWVVASTAVGTAMTATSGMPAVNGYREVDGSSAITIFPQISGPLQSFAAQAAWHEMLTKVFRRSYFHRIHSLVTPRLGNK